MSFLPLLLTTPGVPVVTLLGDSNNGLNFFEVKALPRDGQLLVGLSPRRSVVLDESLS